MYELNRAISCHREILKFLKANYSFNVTSKELKISPITKFYELFKRLKSTRVRRDSFSAQSRLLFYGSPVMDSFLRNDVAKIGMWISISLYLINGLSFPYRLLLTS